MKGLLLDNENDLQVLNGSLVIGDSSLQNQQILLMCDKGELKEYPMRGVGAMRYIETSDNEALAREIRTEFALDGMRIEEIKVNIPNLNITASYD